MDGSEALDALGYVLSMGRTGDEALEAASIIQDGGCVLFSPQLPVHLSYPELRGQNQATGE